MHLFKVINYLNYFLINKSYRCKTQAHTNISFNFESPRYLMLATNFKKNKDM